jgi:hypothetical protein
MKIKSTLLAILFATFAHFALHAQTTTWDFTANNPTWAAAGIGTTPIQTISNGLGMYGISSNGNFAAWNSTSSSTWTSPNDAYTGTIRVQTNGAGFAAGANESTPTQRYFFIQVNQACTVKVWFKSGSTGAARSVIASNGVSNYGKATANTGGTGLPTDGGFLSANVTQAGTFYVYGDAAVNIFQIQVVGATVSLTPVNLLPVKFGALNLSQSNSLTKVSWNVLSEVNTDKYFIERSENASSFYTLGSLSATNTGKYSFVDNAPLAGVAYYRIKAVDKDGTFSYSAILKSNAKAQQTDFTIAPNPVKAGLVNIQLTGMSTGNYSFNVYDVSGKQLFNKLVFVESGNSTETFQLPSTIQPGIYKLQVTNGQINITKTIMVQ